MGLVLVKGIDFLDRKQLAGRYLPSFPYDRKASFSKLALLDKALDKILLFDSLARINPVIQVVD